VYKVSVRSVNPRYSLWIILVLALLAAGSAGLPALIVSGVVLAQTTVLTGALTEMMSLMQNIGQG